MTFHSSILLAFTLMFVVEHEPVQEAASGSLIHLGLGDEPRR